MRVATTQAAVSLWESGAVRISVERIWAIEDALGLPHGWVLIAAGLVNPDIEPLEVLLEASVAAAHAR
jgi:transcriptional regulator with XRE-family HTH domain